MRILSRQFYSRPPTVVARQLIGKTIVRRFPRGALASGVIVETEAYGGSRDRASHAYRGRTARNDAMFGEAGHAYVYFTYGAHHCLNFVTTVGNRVGAVLLRALEPLEGVDAMKKLSGQEDVHELTRGPGKICKALGIDLALNGTDVTVAASPLFVVRAGTEENKRKKIGSSQRVGISSAVSVNWRFYDLDSEFVSRGKINLPRRGKRGTSRP